MAVLVLRGCANVPRAPRSVAREHSHASGRPAAQRPREAEPRAVHRPERDSGAPPGPGSIAASEHVALGVPADRDPSDDYLLDEREYVVSYNPNLHVPNWVAWKLEASDLGHVRRSDHFRADEQLPDGLYRVTPHDYVRGGYDRGHLCPSADRTGTEAANTLTFLMTNMQPQIHELNGGPWERLEQYERERAKRPGARLYIVAGGVFDASPKTIGHGVAVPKASFKIVVILQRGAGARDVAESTPVIAAVMPNEAGVGAHPWTDYVTSVDDIEEETGYDFLSAVPEPVQRAIEARRSGEW